MQFLHNVSDRNRLRDNKIFVSKEVLSLCVYNISSFEEFHVLYCKYNTNKGLQFINVLLEKIDTIKSNRQLNEWINGFNKSL